MFLEHAVNKQILLNAFHPSEARDASFDAAFRIIFHLLEAEPEELDAAVQELRLRSGS